MKHLFLMLLISSNLFTTLFAQEAQDSLVDFDCVHFIVDDPSFPGGDSALVVFIRSNIQYPDTAKQYHMEGVVYASFIVEKNGGLSGFKIIRGIGWGCDEEAIRVLKLMPNWEPATRKGKPVRVQMNIPVRFELKDESCFTIKPSFPGGKDSLDVFISRNIRYEWLRRDEINGKSVMLSLLLDQNGSIIKTYLLRGIGGGCDEEALRIIRKMPLWTPAKCGDKNIPSSYILLVYFVGD